VKKVGAFESLVSVKLRKNVVRGVEGLLLATSDSVPQQG